MEGPSPLGEGPTSRKHGVTWGMGQEWTAPGPGMWLTAGMKPLREFDFPTRDVVHAGRLQARSVP